MKTVELLRDLQATDSALEAERERLAQVEAELADRSELAAAHRTPAECAAALQKIEAEQRDLELEVDTLRGQLQAVEKKLYGGKVGDAKELTNLTRDAQQIKGLIASREDRLLEIFEAAEQASAALTRAEATFRTLQTERRARETELAGERDRLLGAIGTDEARRNTLREQADTATLRTYDHLRQTRNGLAVAELRQRTCQGCRVSLPMGIEQRVRQGDTPVTCQSCGRILFAAG